MRLELVDLECLTSVHRKQGCPYTPNLKIEEQFIA